MRAQDFGRLRAAFGAMIAGRTRRSPAFEDFRLSLFGDKLSEGLDLEALCALRGRERRLAERMLLSALPDAEAIAGLTRLGSPRARRRLEALFEEECARARTARLDDDGTWSGAVLIATAAALWRLAPNYRYARAVVGRLRHAPSWRERTDAAIALGKMPTAEVDRALTEALDDADALVRHYAARALLEVHGVAIDARAAHCMVYRVMASEADRRAGGRRDIAAALVDRPRR